MSWHVDDIHCFDDWRFYQRPFKIHKYRHLANDFHFIPIGTETLGTFGPEAIKFLEDLGHKLSLINGEKRSKSFTSRHSRIEKKSADFRYNFY